MDPSSDEGEGPPKNRRPPILGELGKKYEGLDWPYPNPLRDAKGEKKRDSYLNHPPVLD